MSIVSCAVWLVLATSCRVRPPHRYTPPVVPQASPAAISPDRSGSSRALPAAPAAEPQPGPGDERVVPASANRTQQIAVANAALRDIFFTYDRSDLTGEAVATLQGNAMILRPLLEGNADIVVTIEGHCDERGSAEYNLALGDLRARTVAQWLTRFGVAPAPLRTVSYGREMPQCGEATESCWSRNRRAHLVVRDPGLQ